MPKNKDTQPHGQTEKDQDRRNNSDNSSSQAAGTQRQPYENDTGDPSTEQPRASDEDVTAGQQGQPGLPEPEEEEWSPGSDSEVA